MLQDVVAGPSAQNVIPLDREKRQDLSELINGFLPPGMEIPENVFEFSADNIVKRNVTNFGYEFKVRQEFFTRMSQMSRKDRMSGGHKMSVMLLTCTFRGQDCSTKLVSLSYDAASVL